ncbi:MAG: dehydrogenase, partial [Vulcanococcus sp.]
HRYHSRTVVVADGSASTLAQPLGLGPARPRYDAAVAAEVEAEVLEPSTARFEFGLVRHGFCWAFPRQGGYSIGGQAEALDRYLVAVASGDGAAAEAALEGYSGAMRSAWGDSMAWGRRIAQVFYRVPKVGYQIGIKRPTAPQRIAQILSGEMGYGDIAQRVIKRLLFQRG